MLLPTRIDPKVTKGSAFGSVVVLFVGCSTLIGESFDYKARTKPDAGETRQDAGDDELPDAGSGAPTTDARTDSPAEPSDAGSSAGEKPDDAAPPRGRAEPPSTPGPSKPVEKPDQDASGPSATPPTTRDEDDAGVPGLHEGPVPLGERCSGTPTLEIAFDSPSDLNDWIVVAADTPQAVPPGTHTALDGSPRAGAAMYTADFAQPWQSFKVGTKNITARAVQCISARIKVLGRPDNPSFMNEKAGWLLWAKDRMGCFAQAEIGKDPWYHYEITQADVWYEVGIKTSSLVPATCTTFDASQIVQFGTGLASGSVMPWQAHMLTDTIRAY